MEISAVAGESSTSATKATIRNRPPRSRFLAVWNGATPYLFLIPFMVVFLAFFFAPFVYDIIQSFYTLKHFGGLGLTPPKVVWNGLANYQQVLTDANFWRGFGRVLIFGIIQIPVMMSIAMILALLLDAPLLPFRRFFRLAAFIPYAVPGVVAAILWGYFYTPNLSPIVQALSAVHLPVPNFLSNSTILWSIGNISTWEYAGFNMLIFYSAMQAIPQELYEAARLDGLSEIDIARFIKIPMIWPAFMLGLLFSMIGTLQLFNEPEILRGISGAITPTYTPNIYAYNIAIIQSNFYYGGAIAAILGIITFVFSFFFVLLTQRQTGA